MSNYGIGVDIGGSHVTAALVDLNLKTVVKNSRRRQSVNSNDEAARIIVQWCNVIQSVYQADVKDINIGIAMPGPFDYEQGISYITGLGKYENLYRLNVKQLMSDVLGVSMERLLMNNDAACFLHGEMFAGAGRGYKRSIGITLGTGTGTAVHHLGVTRDANLGPSLFLDSIADNYLSTRWFVSTYERLSGNRVTDVLELVSRYGTDPVVRNVFMTFSMNLALLLADFISREDPQVVIMGGNISKAAELFLPQTEAILRDKGIHVPIVKAILDEDATMLGAASLFTATGRIVSA